MLDFRSPDLLSLTKGASMPTKNEIFMLAKINVLENITAQFLVMFLEALKPGSP